MKLFFIVSSVYILYLMTGPYLPTNNPNLDSFKVEFLVLAAFVAAMVFNYAYNLPEVFSRSLVGVLILGALVV